uniref:Uncharacterized protein n=1 Tax=Acrobeloides nanus TaxID=290746 RepID=A0A914BW85_9BILA
MDEISGHPWKFPGDYWFSRRDVPYTESIFLNKNCTFIGHDEEYLKGDTVERRYNDRNSTVPFNFPTHNKFLSATCTCANVEENESASNGTGTEIETFFEDVIEVKTEQIVTLTSSTRPFCVGMLLGVILTVGLYGLYTYRDQFVPLINRVRNGASRIHTPSYNNPLYMNGNNEHLQGLNSHSYHI